MNEKIIDLTVYDCFSGKVKLLKKRPTRIYIEIVDVVNCYSQQVPTKPGERFWIKKTEIIKVRNRKKKRTDVVPY